MYAISISPAMIEKAEANLGITTKALHLDTASQRQLDEHLTEALLLGLEMMGVRKQSPAPRLVVANRRS